mgnify:CR=1 FL=1
MTLNTSRWAINSSLGKSGILFFLATTLYSAPASASYFELVSTTDKKISSNFFDILDDNFRQAYSIVSGVERDIVAEGVSQGYMYYKGFDLNSDTLFSYSDISNYSDPTPQSYVINNLTIQVKLKDDNYSECVFGVCVDLGDDIPEENGRIDVQLFTDDYETFGGSWPNSLFGTREIDDGDTFTWSIDFTENPLDHADWYNRGEIIVTAYYPSLIANSDFIVDSVKITGDRTLYDPITPIPVPAAFWLFGSALGGLVGLSRRRQPA